MVEMTKTSIDQEKLSAALDRLPYSHRGPGGAVAVVQDGELIAQRVWGYADMDHRIAMSNRTLMPICSLTKQFVCAALLDIIGGAPDHPVRLGLDDLQPGFVQQGLTVAHLCNNQSGIRDYWALTLLMGAHPEGKFTKQDSERMRSSHRRTLQFEPGEQYSYSNGNFHILARLIVMETGFGVGDALRKSIFEPASMQTATFCEDTGSHPGECIGYEGNPSHGFRPAVNNVWWSGDAGIVASLDDLIAYERWVDSTRADPNSLYRRLCLPQTFRDGKRASYGYGLAHSNVNGIPTVGHSGAIRGFRVERLHAPSERLSVVAMFNHETDWGAAEGILRVALGVLPDVRTQKDRSIDPSLYGDWLDRKTNLVIAIGGSAEDGINVSFAGYSEHLSMTGPASARSREMQISIVEDKLHVDRFEDNLSFVAERIEGDPGAGYGGSYHCAELESTLYCSGDMAAMYGGFDGFLGAGPMHLMHHRGGDVWVLENPRGMDAPAPGDWTVVFERGDDGKITGATVGCWLARNLRYTRISGKA